MELLNRAWPEWEVVKELGAGAFGKVYEIKKSDLGGEFHAALKCISIPSDENEVKELMSEGMDKDAATDYYSGIVEEIAGEFALMERLKGNTNIVSYEDHKLLPKENGIGWDIIIRMELLKPLNSYLLEHAFTEAEVVKLGIDICKALELCQKQNVIHRDIKPENIFMSEFGDFKLGDFGIARTVEKTTMGMSRKGTVAYMAPEVYLGKPYSAKVDIYSLGIVLYRLLNDNRTPFLPAAPNPITYMDKENAQVKRMSGEAVPAPSHASEAMANIIAKACAFDPQERYASATEMRKALEQVQAGVQQDTDKTEVLVNQTTSTVIDKDATVVETVSEAQVAKNDNVSKSSAVKTTETVKPANTEKTKKKTGLIAGIVALCAVALIAIAVVATRGLSKEGSGDTVEVANAGFDEELKAKSGKGSALGVQIVPEMLWGKYTPYDPESGKSIDIQGNEYFMKNAGMRNIVMENIQGEKEEYEIFALPTEITCGRLKDMKTCWNLYIPDPYSSSVEDYFNNADANDKEYMEQLRKDFAKMYGEEGLEYYNNFSKLMNTTFMLVYYNDKTFTMNRCSFQNGLIVIDGKNVKLVNINVDPRTYEITQGDIIQEFDIGFEGRNMVLYSKKGKILYQPREFSEEAESNGWILDVGGYVSDINHMFDDISDFSYFDYRNGEEPYNYVGFSKGGHAIDPYAEFNEDGTFKIAWDKQWVYYNGRDIEEECQTVIEGEYICCDEYGIIIKVDGEIYRYQSNRSEYNSQFIDDDVAESVSDTQKEALVSTKSDITENLTSTLQNDGIDTTVDITGRVNLDTSILFAVDSADISAEGKAELDAFLKVYAQVILPYYDEGLVSAVKVEGHTDTDGSYEHNQDLSERRAQAVYDYCKEIQPELAEIMETEGFSYSDPIFDENGKVDKAASRRVVFRFVLAQ